MEIYRVMKRLQEDPFNGAAIHDHDVPDDLSFALEILSALTRSGGDGSARLRQALAAPAGEDPGGAVDGGPATEGNQAEHNEEVPRIRAP